MLRVAGGRNPPATHFLADNRAVRVLVTGAAGYIGAHVAWELGRAGFSLLCLDDLSRGHMEAILRLGRKLPPGSLVFRRGRVGDRRKISSFLRDYPCLACIHLAGLARVEESVARPELYFRKNVSETLALLEVLERAGVRVFVFSSSAAVYGRPAQLPLREDSPCRPESPYGRAKLMVEGMLHDFSRAYGWRVISLRYFNVAGAHPDGDLGEDHRPETHLIPRAIGAVLHPRKPLLIHGTDYPTRDGTAVRDYVNVLDLARAHRLALESLLQGHPGGVYNLGTGEGFTVREVLEAVSRVTGRRVPQVEGPRRPGDPEALVASCERARREWGWEPETGLEETVTQAWRWHLSYPQGYGREKGSQKKSYVREQVAQPRG